MSGLSSLFGFEAEQIKKAVDALKKYNLKKQEAQQYELFSDDPFFLNLQVQFNKCPKEAGYIPRPQLLQITNPFHNISEVDICLFVGNKGNNDDALVKQFEGKFGINKVISARELKKQYDTSDALKKLQSQYDLFLVDDRESFWIPKFLGHTFASKSAYPFHVNLGINKEATTSVEQQILDICGGTWMTLSVKDKLFIHIGRIDMPTEQLYQNCMEILEQLNDLEILPVGYEGIQSLYVTNQTQDFIALPIWFNVLSDLDSDVVPEDLKQKNKPGNKKKKKKVKDDKLYYISDEDVGKKLQPQVAAAAAADLGEEVDIEDEDEEINRSENIEEDDENQEAENISEEEEEDNQKQVESQQQTNKSKSKQEHTNGISNKRKRRKKQNLDSQQEINQQNEEVEVQLLSSAAGKRKSRKVVENGEDQNEGDEDTQKQPRKQSKKGNKNKGKYKENKNFLVV